MVEGLGLGGFDAYRIEVAGEQRIASPRYLMAVCLEDGCGVTLDEGRAPFRAGHALLLKPGKQAVLNSASGTGFLAVEFDDEAVRAACLPALAGNPMLADFFLREEDEEGHLAFLELDYLTGQMLSLTEVLVELARSSEPEDKQVALGMLCELLRAVTFNCFMHTVLAHELGQQPFQKVCAYMLNARGLPSAQQIAEHFYYHTNTLSRVIRRGSGMSFGDFRRMIRLSFAAQQLRGGDVTVRKAAADCGYANMTHFYRQFEEVYGIVPGDYQALFN